MFRFAPYRAPAAAPDCEAPAFVHECGDIIVTLRAPLGPATLRLDPRTVDVGHEPRLYDLSVPLLFTAFLFAACEAGALMLLSRTMRGVPDGTLRVLWIPLILVVVAIVGAFDPTARRVEVRGMSRSGHRVVMDVTFASARGASRFVTAAREAVANAESDARP